ncbi:HNH endonuclease [Zhongshania borealis]|uniref:HNH domain-containing protein n=1 Tax=Zhongshania borealis TaxID=889488 RepID=A0ABP7W9K5_9GAMM
MGDPLPRNPAWKREELILALELYFNAPGAVGNNVHPDVITLSDTLNSLPIHPTVEGRATTFRNPNGVGLKLANFRAIDPKAAGAGMSSASKLDKMVFEEFSDDLSRLRKTAKSIRELSVEVPRRAAEEALDIDEQDGQNEGGIIERVHRTRERNSKLIKQKKQAVLKRTGTLLCEVCDFDFHAVYGDIGKEFAECHHKKPVSEMTKGEKTRLDDLAIVCSNCHRMIHRYRPWKAISELRALILERKTS